MYANALENVSPNTTSCEENIFRALGTYMRHPFDVVELQQRYHENLFVNDDTYLMLLCQHVWLTLVQHTEK